MLDNYILKIKINLKVIIKKMQLIFKITKDKKRDFRYLGLVLLEGIFGCLS